MLITASTFRNGRRVQISADAEEDGAIHVTAIKIGGTTVDRAAAIKSTCTDQVQTWDCELLPEDHHLRFEFWNATLYSFSYAD